MELKDPITNATLTEEQLMAAKLPDTTISPSDDENSSIITVRSNASNNNNNNNEITVRLHLATEDNDSAGGELHSGSGGGSFLTAVQHHQPSNVIDVAESTQMQTIVEVVNPLVSGQGYANTIAVGGSNDDGSYPSFDPSNDDGNVNAPELNYDSLDVYNTASELSLSDKMKNVLQELVKNERVRLSFSQSISEGEDTDSEQNDTDDDANEPLKHDSSDDESVIPIRPSIESTVTEENGNAAGTAAAVVVAAATTAADGLIAQLNIVDTVASDSGNNDDIKNANIIDDDFILTNPNFLSAGDEIDASTSQQQTTTATTARNERDEKIKEKLLAELNVQPSAATDDMTRPELGNIDSTNEPEAEEESSISAPTSPTETSSKSDSISSSTGTGTGSSKRKKRKNKARKK